MSTRVHSARLLLAGLGLVGLVGYAVGQVAAPASGPAVAPAKAVHEYRIVQDVGPSELATLAAEGWEYAGYLGEGFKGRENDETLWRRPR